MKVSVNWFDDSTGGRLISLKTFYKPDSGPPMYDNNDFWQAHRDLMEAWKTDGYHIVVWTSPGVIEHDVTFLPGDDGATLSQELMDDLVEALDEWSSPPREAEGT